MRIMKMWHKHQVNKCCWKSGAKTYLQQSCYKPSICFVLFCFLKKSKTTENSYLQSEKKLKHACTQLEFDTLCLLYLHH